MAAKLPLKKVQFVNPIVLLILQEFLFFSSPLHDCFYFFSVSLVAYRFYTGNLNWPIMIQQVGKTLLSWRHCKFTGKELKMALHIYEKEFIVPRTVSHCKKWKIWNILCPRASNLAPKWVAFVQHGNSLVVRWVSSGRIIVVLFSTKYVVPCPIQPRILKLTFRRDQGNFSIIFTFGVGSCYETGNLRVVSLGQLSFDCSSYYGLSHRM